MRSPSVVPDAPGRTQRRDRWIAAPAKRTCGPELLKSSAQQRGDIADVAGTADGIDKSAINSVSGTSRDRKEFDTSYQIDRSTCWGLLGQYIPVAALRPQHAPDETSEPSSGGIQYSYESRQYGVPDRLP